LYFWFAPKAVVVPAKRLGIDLLLIDNAVTEAEGFPRPQWPVIREWIKQNVSSDDFSIAWHEAAQSWLTLLKQRLGPSYAGYQSDNFLLLTS
jgi:hypothetical protein